MQSPNILNVPVPELTAPAPDLPVTVPVMVTVPDEALFTPVPGLAAVPANTFPVTTKVPSDVLLTAIAEEVAVTSPTIAHDCPEVRLDTKQEANVVATTPP
jgi:hypothetical protein